MFLFIHIVTFTINVVYLSFNFRTLELDCLTRGSARSFVQSHKRIVLNGQDLTVVAVDEKTMGMLFFFTSPHTSDNKMCTLTLNASLSIF